MREVRLPAGEAYEVTGEGFKPEGRVLAAGRPVGPSEAAVEAIARAAVLCNEADLHHRDGDWVWRGDPTDVALLALGHRLRWNAENALERYPRVNQIPFEPEHRFAASFHRAAGSVRVFVKGAPERVIGMCDLGGPGAEPAAARQRVLETARDMAARGMRVLALAEGPAPTDLNPSRVPPEPSGLTFIGLIGMIDPLRPGAAEAVGECRRAGVAVWMVTGDHPVTALAIARDLGLTSDPQQVVTGAELAGMSPAQLEQVVACARVYARVSPQQKLKLVGAARRVGHLVAATGDGVNDAPALRAANIRVAMGRGGTDVARDAAELVITDDNFATIVAGIEEGRVAYKNVRNLVYMLAATGAGEVVLTGASLAAGLPLPLLPVQLLWLNLVTNGIQDVALAFEPGSGNELRRPPRPPHEQIFNRLMVERVVLSAAVMGAVGTGTFAWLLRAGWSEQAARDALLLLMVLFENVLVGNAKSETRPALSIPPLRNPLLLAGVAGALLIHVFAMHNPLLQHVLGTETVGLSTWLALAALALTLFVVMETHRWLRRWRLSPPLGPRREATSPSPVAKAVG